ncbi:hypothetical protein VOLCADRAFT_108396 [Volvox carteri f. nagariensis]|uniref:Uncharacterized protein n=1 Tax=Volvox carteri f. nagariensis TaxID=3068 RepID=D8UJX9_VOLCA|nr:uncharacterized protein VOLCADRAFT_108396 [Volvox carteri f. nagariensis]EFJ39971.1 hypothetical protein VOLCADRAFT_108396 [Volvox carteri f. nagariensis]|eukprot:XP_002958966.1 hypothetical protein VOLCADRAFT_108396 [Volvox carteri f. nagariensis]
MSQRDADTFISNNERDFILKALSEECRLDGRRPYDLRKPKFQFSLDDRSATVALGSTRVLSVVTASLEVPFPDRPSEGPLRFNVEFSPMASPAFEPGRPGRQGEAWDPTQGLGLGLGRRRRFSELLRRRPSCRGCEDAIQIARLIERGLRQSGAVDQEALCVVAGRKPEVEVGGESGTDILVHPPEVREPLPLTIHHLPVAVTFGLFQGGDLLVVDPSWREEAAASGSCTVVMNPGREVCCVHKADGIGLTPDQFMRCVRLAGDKAEQLVADLKAALEQHEVARVQARVRRHQQVVGLPDPAARHVMVLGAKDPAATGAAGTGATASGASTVAAAAATATVAASRKSAADTDDLDEDEDLGDDEEEEEEEEGEEGKKMEVEDARKPGGEASGGGDDDDGGNGGGNGGAGRAPRDTDMGEVAAPQHRHQRTRLAGPLVAASKSGYPDGASKRGSGAGAGALSGANKRGKDGVGFDELEAIAAVIAGVTPGAPEPELSAAIKPGKLRKSSGTVGKKGS